MNKPPCLVALILTLGITTHAAAQTPPMLAQRTAGLQRQDGFLPFYLDAAKGRVLLEIPRLNEELLYFVTVSKGIGSVELGVDRGAGGESSVIEFQRWGPRVLVVAKNLQYRALTGNRALLQGIEESFATSTLAALPIEAEEGGRILVDATSFIVRDATDLEGVLRRRSEGTFRLDSTRSGVYQPRSKAFPQNTEIEATLTFASESPGRIIDRVAPDGRALTLRIHHSFLQPPEGYRPRVADPRIGIGALTFKDYSAPYTRDPEVRWIRRWRLEKKDPTAAMSEPKKPIVFYLDPGIPEPVRTAMREGALWWNQAFEAAGFRNALQVLDPPDDMDPMDARYSYILWVNRDERGFSVGGSFSDPRTGEILVAKPRMDSHRIRTISNYWRNYRQTTNGGGGDCGGFLLPYEALLAQAEMQTLSIARTEQAVVLLRQALVTAHEVGHTLGFGHNWTSSINNRASVMEYPSPRVKLTNGRIDLSDSYQRGIGEYDKFMVRYAYTKFPPAREREGLEAIVKEMRGKGILYTPSADPRWNRYDDLASPTAYLRETMAQRKLLLDRYGPAVLRAGEPFGGLRGIGLWMTYLHHRWAIDTAVRYVGGMYDNIAVKGESLPPTEIVPAALQREVLALLMEAIEPANLAIPERLLAELAQNPEGRDIEEFNVSTGEPFDHLSAARTLVAMVLEQLLERERAARIVSFEDRQSHPLALPELVAAVVKTTWGSTASAGESPMHRSLRRVAQREALEAMMILGAQAQATPDVRAVALDALAKLGSELGARHDSNAVTEAHIRQAERDIARYLENPAAFAPRSSAPPQPAGPPLGQPPDSLDGHSSQQLEVGQHPPRAQHDR